MKTDRVILKLPSTTEESRAGLLELLQKVGLEVEDVALDEVLADAEEQLQWCSGSADFAPGGLAREGWEKGPAKTIERLRALRS